MHSISIRRRIMDGVKLRINMHMRLGFDFLGFPFRVEITKLLVSEVGRLKEKLQK